jgi:subtilisin family serine protease
MMSRVWVFGMCVILAAGTVSSANAGGVPKDVLRQKLASSKIRGSVLGMFDKAAGSTIPVLVTLREKADLTAAKSLETREARGRFVYDSLRAVAQRSQRELRKLLDSRGIKYRAYYITNMLAIEGATPDLISELAKREDVARVSGNPSIKMKALPKTLAALEDLPPTPTNIEAIGATRVWNELNVRGENIVVAGQDTGVDWNHPGLKAQYRGFQGGVANHDYNWHDSIRTPIEQPGTGCAYNSPEPCDDDQHGTHTMGTVVGDGGAANQVGVAPKAQWIACRNMDHGLGRPNTYIECFEFFLAPYPVAGNAMTDGDPTQAPHVINNSWGCPAEELCEGDEFIPVLEALQTAGVMVVVSAGNEGPGCSTISAAPAWNSGKMFSVGALNHRDNRIASFSSRGPSAHDGGVGPDVSAPGVNIKSTVPGGGYESFMWSGTSMAGPHVAGLAALIWSAKPALIGQVDATRELIRRTADPLTTTESCGGRPGSAVPNNTFGHGAINAFRAVNEARR